MKEIEDLKVSQGISSAITGVRDGELAALLARVEQAEGSSQEIDARLCAALRYYPDGRERHAEWVTRWTGEWRAVRVGKDWNVALVNGPGQTSAMFGPEDLTASLDAALALCARVLPDANCRGFDETPREVVAYVSRNCVGTGHWLSEGYAKTPALALVAAVLNRLIARPKDDTAERSTEPRETRK